MRDVRGGRVDEEPGGGREGVHVRRECACLLAVGNVQSARVRETDVERGRGRALVRVARTIGGHCMCGPEAELGEQGDFQGIAVLPID